MRTNVIKYLVVTALCLCLSLMLGLNACTSQTTLSALVTTLGNASAAIATLEGNAALGKQLQADTSVAAAAILAWKSGSAATEVIQALNIVQADLNLIPYIAPYSALIDIGIATVDEIITIVTGASPTPPPASALRGERQEVRRSNDAAG